MKILGIDEAGRGPVIGDLVISGVMIEENDEKKLKELGVKDSKLIAPNKREVMFDEIVKITKEYEILIVKPSEIDEAVFSKEMNLNKLEGVKSALIINKLKPDVAILDCPSTNTEAYKEFVKTFLKDKEIKIISEHKADYNYPVVSAASILAKVTRDEGIVKLREKYGDLGSGYPADERTQEFIKNNFEKHPEIFRKSWATFKNLQKSKEQAKLGEF
jgi:ribonuclease HII